MAAKAVHVHDAATEVATNKFPWKRCLITAGISFGTYLALDKILPRIFAAYRRWDVNNQREFRQRLIALPSGLMVVPLGYKAVKYLFQKRHLGENFPYYAGRFEGYLIYDFFVSLLQWRQKKDTLFHHAFISLAISYPFVLRRYERYIATAALASATDAVVHSMWLMRKTGLMQRLSPGTQSLLRTARLIVYIGIRIGVYSVVIAKWFRHFKLQPLEIVVGLSFLVFLGLNAHWTIGMLKSYLAGKH